MKDPWTKEEDSTLKKIYTTNNKSTLLQLLSRRNYNSIKGRAALLGIKKRERYTKDEKFFETPNIINCAVAGFISSDGNVQNPIYKDGRLKSNGRVSIIISSKDIEILYKIKEHTKYNGRIGFREQRNLIKNYSHPEKPPRYTHSVLAALCFYNATQWVNDLNRNWNITPRKSLTIKAPNITKLEHILAYYSGVICGDGTVRIDEGDNLRITLLGTYELLSLFKDLINNLFSNARKKAEIRRERKNSKIFSYNLGGTKAYIVAKMMLCLDIPRLDRKWNIAREYIKNMEKIKDKHRVFVYRLRQALSNRTIIDFLKKHNQLIPIPEKRPQRKRIKKTIDQNPPYQYNI